MITWFSLWPFMSIPFLFPFLLGILPVFNVGNHEIGGPLVRQYCINQVASLIPHDIAVVLVNWFNQASYFQEILLHGVISLNIGLLFYPLFFAIGTLVIRTASWSAKTELSESKKLLNRR